VVGAKRIAAGAGLSIGAVLGLTSAAQAAEIQVTSTADDNGAGTTLREAVVLANNTAVSDEITFQSGLSGQILLTGAGDELDIVEPLAISGPGADVLTVSGLDDQQIFYIDINDATEDKDVTISGLTLADGEADNSDGFGGKDNGSGAVIKNMNANVDLNDAFVTSSSTVEQSNGIIASYSGTRLKITRSTLSGNTGVRAIGTLGYLGLDSSTVSDNDLSSHAISLIQGASDAVVLDTTVSGNGGQGGMSVSGYAYLQNSIFANHSGYDANTAGGGEIQFTMTLVENGYLPPDSINSIVGVDPQLGPVQDNGGPTPTQLPASTSPVVDRGFSRLATDQRGSARVVNFPFLPDVPNELFPNAIGADIGAVELTTAEGPTAPPAPPSAGPPARPVKKCKKPKKLKKGKCVKKKKKRKKKRPLT
jgi:hypothetical protein